MKKFKILAASCLMFCMAMTAVQASPKAEPVKKDFTVSYEKKFDVQAVNYVAITEQTEVSILPVVDVNTEVILNEPGEVPAGSNKICAPPGQDNKFTLTKNKRSSITDREYITLKKAALPPAWRS